MVVQNNDYVGGHAPRPLRCRGRPADAGGGPWPGGPLPGPGRMAAVMSAVTMNSRLRACSGIVAPDIAGQDKPPEPEPEPDARGRRARLGAGTRHVQVPGPNAARNLKCAAFAGSRLGEAPGRAGP